MDLPHNFPSIHKINSYLPTINHFHGVYIFKEIDVTKLTYTFVAWVFLPSSFCIQPSHYLVLGHFERILCYYIIA
jgi:hypothetical protein